MAEEMNCTHRRIAGLPDEIYELCTRTIMLTKPVAAPAGAPYRRRTSYATSGHHRAPRPGTRPVLWPLLEARPQRLQFPLFSSAPYHRYIAAAQKSDFRTILRVHDKNVCAKMVEDVVTLPPGPCLP